MTKYNVVYKSEDGRSTELKNVPMAKAMSHIDKLVADGAFNSPEGSMQWVTPYGQYVEVIAVKESK